MKNFKYLAIACAMSVLAGLLLNSCIEEDQVFGDIIVPSNLVLSYDIVGADAMNPNGDGSGFVNFTATADNAISFTYSFGNDSDNQVAPDGAITNRFTEPGINTYTVTVIATGTGGVPTSTSTSLDVYSAFDDQEAKDFLTGGTGSSKTWYLAAAEPGHLGVGPSLQLDLAISGMPNAFYYPQFFGAAPFEKCGIEISDCLCTDELTFSLSSNNQLTFELNNMGATFFNAGHQDIVGGSVGEDACFDFDTSGTSNVALAPTTVDWSLIPDPGFLTPRGTVMNFSDDAFMGYYVSSSSYEIMEITNDYLYVRTIDGLNPDLAWYHKYSTSPPDATPSFPSEFNTLIWADEFDTDGAPDPANWSYDLEDGCQISPNLCGWGNNEEQWYTNDPSNVVVQGGNLVITAKAESIMGYNYSSARIKTQDLFEFQNGRVEIRAKLPEGGGTWPALWMLGANNPDVGWPESGEMDIMEHVGNNLNEILGTVHWDTGGGVPGSFGEITTIENATTEFHTYTLEWRDDEILILVDDVVYFTFGYDATFPFNQDFFLIFNIAMGGDLGGSIDPGFTESTMEVDYIRVYQ